MACDCRGSRYLRRLSAASLLLLEMGACPHVREDSARLVPAGNAPDARQCGLKATGAKACTGAREDAPRMVSSPNSATSLRRACEA